MVVGDWVNILFIFLNLYYLIYMLIYIGTLNDNKKTKKNYFIKNLKISYIKIKQTFF
jgi:hypothetical protein